ncbi:MAG: hypothetical protein H0W72_09055 [Planctomycetes bacterium]|nr:hypothetical protein [Planctomycetota bacterium]
MTKNGRKVSHPLQAERCASLDPKAAHRPLDATGGIAIAVGYDLANSG